MAQSPCFLLPLPIPSLHPFLLPFTYLETLLGVIGSCPPWSQVTCELNSPFSIPPHPSPFQIPSIPSQISPASHANKDDDSTPASRVRNKSRKTTSGRLRKISMLTRIQEVIIVRRVNDQILVLICTLWNSTII
jgi:hypothetical protein